ncbi:hypothetical protein EJB05_09534, partial [Eragrostis curvula]
ADVYQLLHLRRLRVQLRLRQHAGAPRLAHDVRRQHAPAGAPRGRVAMTESLPWLAMRGRHGEAQAVLLRTLDTQAEAVLRQDEMKQGATKGPQTSGGGGGFLNELIVRPSASVRPIVVCVVGLRFFLHTERRHASNDTALGTTVVGVVKTCFILVVTLLSDRAGQCPLLLASASGVAATLVSIALTLRVPAASSSSPATEQLACVASVLVATYGGEMGAQG